MSERQLNLLSFFKIKELHGAPKRVRVETTTHEGGGSDHASEHGQLQEATVAVATIVAASQVNRQEQRAATTAASQVYRQEQGATTTAASQVYQEQEDATEMASQVQQQEDVDSHSKSNLEGEESAFSGDKSSDRSGMQCSTIWTATQFKVKQTCYPWLVMDN